jgi:hypothetical protein
MAAPLTPLEAKTMSHLEAMEGWRSKGYVPSNRSGVTIGYGIDLSQPPYNTAEGLRQNGFSEEFINKAISLGVLGKDAEALGGMAEAKKLAKQLTVPNTKAEKNRQFRLIQTNVDQRAEKYSGKMDENAFVSYKTLNHWSGGGMSKEQRDKISADDLAKGIRNPYDRKAYVAGVIEDELDRIYQEKGYITEEEYQAAIIKGQNSVPNFSKKSPMNNRTLNRELKFVQKNSGKTVTNETYENILSPPYQVTQEEAERVYGPTARLATVQGKDVITYTDDFGDPQQVDVNTVTEESPDYEPTPMLDEVVVKPTPERTIPIPPDTETRQDRTQTQAPPDTEIVTEESEADRRKRIKLEEEAKRQRKREQEREADALRYQELQRKKKKAIEYYGPDSKRAKRFDEEINAIEEKYNLFANRPTPEDIEKDRAQVMYDIMYGGDVEVSEDSVELQGKVEELDAAIEKIEEELKLEEQEGPGRYDPDKVKSLKARLNSYKSERDRYQNALEESRQVDVEVSEIEEEEEREEDPVVQRYRDQENYRKFKSKDRSELTPDELTELERIEQMYGLDPAYDPNAPVEGPDPNEDPLADLNETFDTEGYTPSPEDLEEIDDIEIEEEEEQPVDDIPVYVEPETEERPFQTSVDAGQMIYREDLPEDAVIENGIATFTDPETGETRSVLVVPEDESATDDSAVSTASNDSAASDDDSEQGGINYLDSLGDLGNVLSQGLGIVQSVRDMIGNPDDLMMTALGKKAYAEAMKEIKPADYPGLSAQFKEHLNQTQQLAKMGFSIEEAQKAKSQIDAAYGKGIENAVRGTAGDRAKFLAMSGVLDSQRQSALLDFAAKDAALQRQNQAQYTKALSFAEEYELNKTKAERAEELQLTLQQKKGASEFAKTVFAQISQNNANRRLAPVLNKYKNELLNSMSGGGSPYTLTTPNVTTGQ